MNKDAYKALNEELKNLKKETEEIYLQISPVDRYIDEKYYSIDEEGNPIDSKGITHPVDEEWEDTIDEEDLFEVSLALQKAVRHLENIMGVIFRLGYIEQMLPLDNEKF